MKLILHLVGKDLLFLRGRLTAWFAVMGAKFAIGFWLVWRADVSDAALIKIQGGVAGLIVIDAALTLLLGALLVQEDSVAGTAAFWRTRPISGARLLAAKLLGALLLFVVPAVAVAVPWWWICGLGLADMGMAALEVVAFQGGLLLVAYTAASVTDSIGRCFVWGLVGVAVAQGIAGIWGYWLAKPVGASTGGTLLMLGIFLPVWMTGVIVWQFQTRRVRVGLALLLTGVVVLPPMALLLGWKIDAPRSPLDQTVRDERPELTRDIVIAWKSAGIREAITNGRPFGQIEMRYEIEGVPAGYAVTGMQAGHELRWGNGEILPVLRSAVRGENAGLMAAQFAAVDGSAAAAPRTVGAFSSVAVARGVATRARTEPIDLVANLAYQVVRPELKFSLPAGPGPWRTRGGLGLRVVRVEPKAGGPAAVLLEAQPLGAIKAGWREVTGRWYPASSYNPHYVLRWPGIDQPLSRSGRSYAAVALGGVQLRQRTLELGRPGQGRDEGASGALPATASLSVVDLTTWAIFRREVTVPRMQPE